MRTKGAKQCAAVHARDWLRTGVRGLLVLAVVAGVSGCRRAQVAPAAAPVQQELRPWRPLWTSAVGAPLAGPPTPWSNGWVVATRTGRLVALDHQGAQRWEWAGAHGVLAGAPAVAGNRVVVGSVDGWLMAVAADSGRPVWQVQVAGSYRHGVLAIGSGTVWQVVWLASDSGVASGVDAADGRLRWRTPPTNRSGGAPGSDGQFLAFGNCDAAVHLFRVADGAAVARVPVGPESQMAGGVLVEDGRVYGGTRSGQLVCVAAAEGVVRWQVEAFQEEAFVTPVRVGHRVVLANASGGVAAFDAATGAVQWRVALSNEVTALCAAEQAVFAVAGGRLIGLQAGNGQIFMSRAVGDRVSGPSWNGRVVAVADDGGTVTGLGR
jgi:outer membrane protein assembly factor BamB